MYSPHSLRFVAYHTFRTNEDKTDRTKLLARPDMISSNKPLGFQIGKKSIEGTCRIGKVSPYQISIVDIRS